MISASRSHRSGTEPPAPPPGDRYQYLRDFLHVFIHDLLTLSGHKSLRMMAGRTRQMARQPAGGRGAIYAMSLPLMVAAAVWLPSMPAAAANRPANRLVTRPSRPSGRPASRAARVGPRSTDTSRPVSARARAHRPANSNPRPAGVTNPGPRSSRPSRPSSRRSSHANRSSGQLRIMAALFTPACLSTGASRSTPTNKGDPVVARKAEPGCRFRFR
jgi:hypothetical protein